MGGGHQIDVFGTLGKEVFKEGAKLGGIHGLAHSAAADGGVLAVSAPQGAAAKEDSAAAAAAAATKNKRVGILGTAATIRSTSFEKALLAIDPSIQVTATPCPLFVSLVESGWIAQDDDVAVPMVRRYLAAVKAAGVDTLILGCTHFPLLAPIIHAELGDDVTLIDSGRETALECAKILKEQGALADRHQGESLYFVSDQPEDFSRVAEIFLGKSVRGTVEKV